VVPEVNRICNGVSRESPATARPLRRAACPASLRKRAANILEAIDEAAAHRPQQVWAERRPPRVRRTPPFRRRPAEPPHSARDAAVKGRNPLGAVFSPQQNAVARSNAPLGQKRGKASAQMRNLPIRGCPPPVALKADYGNLTVETAEIVEQCSQMIAHENTGTFMVAARTAGAAVLCCRHPSQSKIEAWI